jgi:isopropylmalate/homocitrate/citramalate synthase
VEYLHSKGTEIIQCCKIWIKNWETVLDNIKDEVTARRSEKLEATAEKFKDYTPDQLKALVAAVQRLQDGEDVKSELRDKGRY